MKMSKTLIDHPHEIVRQMAHVFRKEVHPRYEPGGSGAAFQEILTLAREWFTVVFWYLGRAAVAWFVIVGAFFTFYSLLLLFREPLGLGQ